MMNGKILAALAIGLVIGFFVTLVARQPEAHGQEKAKAQQQWEYRVVFASGNRNDDADAQKLTTEFNTLAADGWEYVSPVVTQPRYSLVLFKRCKS